MGPTAGNGKLPPLLQERLLRRVVDELPVQVRVARYSRGTPPRPPLLPQSRAARRSPVTAPASGPARPMAPRRTDEWSTEHLEELPRYPDEVDHVAVQVPRRRRQPVVHRQRTPPLAPVCEHPPERGSRDAGEVGAGRRSGRGPGFRTDVPAPSLHSPKSTNLESGGVYPRPTPRLYQGLRDVEVGSQAPLRGPPHPQSPRRHSPHPHAH